MLFITAPDGAQRRGEPKARRAGQPVENRIFPDGESRWDGATKPRPCDHLGWSRFKNLASAGMYEIIDKPVFPFLQTRSAASAQGAECGAGGRGPAYGDCTGPRAAMMGNT